jgi:cbb3-type cytochrome oxidase cytochrome c subunit
MHAKIKNNQIFEYPIINLFQKVPDISLPADLTDDSLLPEGYVFVHNSDVPAYDQLTQHLVETTPVYIETKWVRQYNVEQLSQENIAKLQDAQAMQIRQIRDQKITDFQPRILKAMRLQSMNQPHEDLQVLYAYVQALADVPQQPDFPVSVTWPQEPNP